MSKFLSREQKFWDRDDCAPEFVDPLRNLESLLIPGFIEFARREELPYVPFDWDLFPIEFVEKFRREECYDELKNRYLDVCRKALKEC
jgi:hypothetical protein